MASRFFHLMGALATLHKNLQTLALKERALAIVAETGKEIAEINAYQMYQGKDSEDKPIEPFYKPLTISIKRMKGQPVDRVTLRDSGSFQDKMKVEVSGTRFTITSDDEKRDKLVKKYGEQIFGLSYEGKVEYIRDTFMPRIKDYIESHLGVRMVTR